MSISVGVAEVKVRATASTFFRICLSTWSVFRLVVCEPPISAARRAPWRTAYPAVILSEIMTLASKPPISRKTNTGMTTAISASDCPRVTRRWFRFMSVALGLQADVRDRSGPNRSERGEEARLPVVGVVNGDADEVAGAIPYVAGRRRPGNRSHRCPVELVAVDIARILGQVALPVLVELVDVDLAHGEQLGAANRVANRGQHLGVGCADIAELCRQSRTLRSRVAGGPNTEHEQRSIEHAHDQEEQDRDDQGKLG